MIELTLALLLLAGTAAVALASWRVLGDAAETGSALFRREAQIAEALRLQRMEEQLAGAQRLAEGAVAGGTGVVRTLHYGIAGIPFGILEAIPVTRGPTRIVRATHDAIADTVYAAIGGANRGVGHLLRAGLAGRKAASDAARARVGATPETPPSGASDEVEPHKE